MKRLLLSGILLLTVMVSSSDLFGADFEMGRKALNQGDYATALKEWKPLAEQGDARAQTVLGLMYTNGIGVPRDDAEAVKWFRLAADQGYAQAQYNLGVMYAVGQGIQQDDAEAVKWYRLAAVQGYVKAKNALKITEPKLAKQSKKKPFEVEKGAQLKAEEETRLRAEKEAQLKAKNEARLKAEKEARLKTEKEARLKAVEEQRLAVIEEGMRLEGALTIQDKKLIQIGLKKLGFLTGDVDGVFGTDTRKTIRAYQLSLPQDASGFLDADQLASLRAIGQSVGEARPPEKYSRTEEGFSLFGIKIFPWKTQQQTDR